MVDDIIQPTWSGGEEKVVAMTCRAFKYCDLVYKPKLYKDSKQCEWSALEHVCEDIDLLIPVDILDTILYIILIWIDL